MGQTYRVAIEGIKGGLEITTAGAKLMEFSYIDNFVTKAIASKIFNSKAKVYLVGDYWESGIDNFSSKLNPSALERTRTICELVSNYDNLPLCSLPLEEENSLSIRGGYFVNYSNSEFIQMSSYIYKSIELMELGIDKDWVISPVSLLCAIGNGYGDGDYHGLNDKLCGRWVGDWISYEESLPGTIRKELRELDLAFKE